MEVDWISIAQTSSPGYSNGSQYLLPGGIPKTYGLYAVGYEEEEETSSFSSENSGSLAGEQDRELGESENKRRRTSSKVTYCYLGIAEDRTLQQCLLQHFQSSGKCGSRPEPAITRFLQDNCSRDGGSSSVYIKFIEVELDFLSAGSLVECLETAIGYALKFNKKDTL